MIKQLLILLLLVASIDSYCCDCKTISKETEYVNSDFVFLGKIISINDKFFEVKILEVFKGKEIKIIKSYISNCGIHPKKDEIWLLYSKKNADKTFFISTCGNSRSFSKPFILTDTSLPPPPPITKPTFLNQINEKSYFKIALLQLKLDIEKLRQIKYQNELIVLRKSHESQEKQMKLLKSVLVCVIGIFLFRWLRVRKIKQ
ncbi:hypothetical protein [Flavobacterium collinsii]|uniref:GOLD domain-containing protein n=1 Tax=Flavobacterium collinsii TaxID=1114861 RepID=A0A9W4TFA3_9FLAO|nr:hypothetical protein [Flavobacterium collinsii]CAI2766940.1 conserved exported protein of unknown function [Flavobacterium collinsii]